MAKQKQDGECRAQDAKSAGELDALKAALAVLAPDGKAPPAQNLNDTQKPAVRAAVAVVHNTLTGLEQSYNKFPDARNPELISGYQKLEAALTEAVAKGHISHDAIEHLRAFTKEHRDAAKTTIGACVSTAQVARR